MSVSPANGRRASASITSRHGSPGRRARGCRPAPGGRARPVCGPRPRHERLGRLVGISTTSSGRRRCAATSARARGPLDAHAIGDLDQRGGPRRAGPQLGREQLAQPRQAGALARPSASGSASRRRRTTTSLRPSSNASSAARRSRAPRRAGRSLSSAARAERGDRDGRCAPRRSAPRRSTPARSRSPVRPDARPRDARPAGRARRPSRAPRGRHGARGAGGLPDGGAHERVPEPQLVAVHRDELRGDRRGQLLNSVFAGGQRFAQRAAVVERGDQQQPARRLGQPGDPGGERVLEPRRQRQPRREQRAGLRGRSERQLDERQRIAGGL